MKKRIVIFIIGLCCATQAMQAQSTKTVETQKDRYGRITGTATTTTRNSGKQSTTTYKDKYGRVTGAGTTRNK